MLYLIYYISKKGCDLMLPAIIIWSIAFVILFIIETQTFQFVTIWLALGALAALIAAVCKLSFVAQIVIFLIVSVMFLVVTRPFVKKHLQLKKNPTNSDLDIGAIAVVIAEITKNSPGRAKLNGVDWIAISSTGEPIEVGEKVEIEKIEGAKLIVKKIN